jgi:uncharacterized Rmd1/YagE family protein
MKSIKTAEQNFDKSITEFSKIINEKLSKMKTDIIEWMFIFSVGYIAIFTIILYLFLK